MDPCQAKHVMIDAYNASDSGAITGARRKRHHSVAFRFRDIIRCPHLLLPYIPYALLVLSFYQSIYVMSWYMSPDDRINTQEMVQCYDCLAKRITSTNLSVLSCWRI
jgi:hypothetical protein